MDFSIRAGATVIPIRSASTVEEAARQFAFRQFGIDVTTIRLTGRTGRAGYFQTYREMPTGRRVAVGSRFHVAVQVAG